MKVTCEGRRFFLLLCDFVSGADRIQGNEPPIIAALFALAADQGLLPEIYIPSALADWLAVRGGGCDPDAYEYRPPLWPPAGPKRKTSPVALWRQANGPVLPGGGWTPGHVPRRFQSGDEA